MPTPPTSTFSGPDAVPSGDDPDLLTLPAPPKRERTAAVVLMALTALASAWMAVSLLAEARYALVPGQPVDVGDLTSLHPGTDLANRYARATGLLGTSGAIRYGRAAEGDSFRLAPVAGNPGVWVEIRVPEGFEGPRFVPPTNFAGRLVPFRSAGVRHVGLIKSVHAQTEISVPDDAWLLASTAAPPRLPLGRRPGRPLRRLRRVEPGRHGPRPSSRVRDRSADHCPRRGSPGLGHRA